MPKPSPESQHRLVCVAVLVAALTAACAPSEAPSGHAAIASTPQASTQIKPEYDQSGRLQKIEYDRNNDGKADTWGFMDGARVVRVEMDRNGDGQVDRWEYHKLTEHTPTPPPAAEGAVDPSIDRIEEATRFDGTVSRWEYFADGVLSRTEEDTDGNGKVDKWETYENGTLTIMAIDTSGRGTPDRRLLYRADGSLDHIEADASGSGNFQPVAP